MTLYDFVGVSDTEVETDCVTSAEELSEKVCDSLSVNSDETEKDVVFVPVSVGVSVSVADLVCVRVRDSVGVTVSVCDRREMPR